jgi:hypothetical protein
MAIQNFWGGPAVGDRETHHRGLCVAALVSSVLLVGGSPGRLNKLGVANGGIVDAPYGSGLSFRDPDNIALEFFAPPG